METFKVYLTKEQWALVCDNSDEIALEVAKQQPKLAAELGIGLEVVPPPAPTLRRSRKNKPSDPPASSAPAGDSSGSPSDPPAVT